MKYSRLICLIMTLFITLGTVSIVKADTISPFTNVSVSENSQTGIATIKGNADGMATVAIMVLRPGKTMVDVYGSLDNKLSEVMIYSTSVKTALDGTFKVNFDIRRAFGEAVNSGSYPILLVNGSKISDGEYFINHVNMEDIRAALKVINAAADVSEMETAIKNNVESLSLDAKLVNACESLSTDEKVTLYSMFLGQDFDEVSNIKTLFESKAPYAVLRNSKTPISMEHSLTSFNKYYGLKLEDADSDFAKIKNQQNKNIVYNDIIAKGEFTGKEDTTQVFEIASALGYINDVIAPGTMLDVLTKYADTFNISMTQFKELSNKKQSNVLTDMVNTVITDSNSIKTAFDSKVSYYASQKDDSNTGSSSSGGGGSTTTVNVSGIKLPPVAPIIDGSAPGSVADTDVFTDLDSVEWAKTAILELNKNGVISGRENGKFDPQSNVTRAEFVKIITLAFDIKTQNSNILFTDVEQGAWYYNAVISCAENGIVIGNEFGEFAPDGYISREDIAVILFRVAENKGLNLESGDANFADANDMSEYAVNAIGMMQKNGIINGVENNNFAPKKQATRAEASKMVYEMLRKH